MKNIYTNKNLIKVKNKFLRKRKMKMTRINKKIIKMKILWNQINLMKNNSKKFSIIKIKNMIINYKPEKIAKLEKIESPKMLKINKNNNY